MTCETCIIANESVFVKKKVHIVAKREILSFLSEEIKMGFMILIQDSKYFIYFRKWVCLYFFTIYPFQESESRVMLVMSL